MKKILAWTIDTTAIVLLASLCIIAAEANAQSPDSCKDCTKGIIEVKLPNCTPTPACVPVTLSLSTSSVSLAANVTDTGSYTVSGTNIITINNPSGATLSLSGGAGATLSGNKINFSSSGVAAHTVNAQNNPALAPCASEPICANPCNFGGCINCNCSLYKYNGGHMYGWYNVHRYTVSQTQQFTVTATNGCSTATANFSIALSGSNTSNGYVEIWGQSPISLNLSGQKLNLDSSKLVKVDFKLTENSLGKVFWFASRGTPLLVWDPENKGEIKDGKQLFGSWTFGKTWDNGYAALASLDKNKDSKLSGEELAGIRLWNDENKNGVSEKGEVVDLSNYGISSISVKFNREQIIPVHSIKFYIADKGFSYQVNGEEVEAESFDWIVPTGDANANFEAELKRLADQGYQVYEWSEDPYENMNNRSYGYLVVKKGENDKLSGYHIKSLKSDKPENEEYVLYSKEIKGTWSDSRFDFTFQDDIAPGLLSETIKAFASVQNGQIVPEKLEIIHKQGPASEMKRDAKWKILKAEKPF